MLFFFIWLGNLFFYDIPLFRVHDLLINIEIYFIKFHLKNKN